ncbi:hypothetical protein Droror1_Dr00005791 [Drosera rotundifolia]
MRCHCRNPFLNKANNIIIRNQNFNFSSSSSSRHQPIELTSLHQEPGGGSDRKPRPTAAHYDALVNSAGSSNDLSRLRHLLIERINDGCFNSNDTFKFITKTPSSLSRLDSIFNVLVDLPKGFIRKSAFESFVSRLCKLRLTDDARKMFDKMRVRGVELRVTSFHPLINAMTKRKEMGKAWEVLRFMREAGVVPDTTAYNYLLTGYCCIGDMESAVDVLVKMREDGVVGDKRTYDAMVLGSCRAGRVDGAVAILRWAWDDEVPLLHSTYAHVITAMLKLGYYEQAVKFVMCFVGMDRGLDTENLGLLASHLIKLERFAEAKLLLDEMKMRGLQMSHDLRDFYQLQKSS